MQQAFLRDLIRDRQMSGTQLIRGAIHGAIHAAR
jgi:hypothetical protein